MALFRSTFIVLCGVVVVFLGSMMMFTFTQTTLGGTVRDENRGVIGYTCTVYSNALVTLGNQAATTILAATTSRAYTRITPFLTPQGMATNTISVAFGGTATLGSGQEISTTTREIVFGAKSDNPFTGAVSAITSHGSTTVRVVECVYPEETVL